MGAKRAEWVKKLASERMNDKIDRQRINVIYIYAFAIFILPEFVLIVNQIGFKSFAVLS